MKLKILIGLPASGKTTWAREYCAKNKNWAMGDSQSLIYEAIKQIKDTQKVISKDGHKHKIWYKDTIIEALEKRYDYLTEQINKIADK